MVLKINWFFILLCFLFYACDPKGNHSKNLDRFSKLDHITGTYFKLYQSGDTSEISNWKNGIRDGGSKFFYENGQLKKEENYLDGARHGESIEYFEDGTLEKKLIFEHNLPVGISRSIIRPGHCIVKVNIFLMA